ncbi:MAG: DUF3592 domain-containing protein [Nitrospinaceae bacterium]
MFEAWNITTRGKFHTTLILTGMVCALAIYWGTMGILEIFADRQLAVESKHWPATDGMIIKSGWQTDPDKRDFAIIEFLYEVNNEEYTSGRVSFNSQRIYQKELMEQYKPGNPVSVYYLSSDPQLSVLEPGNPEAVFGMKMLIRSGYILAGLFGTWLIFRKRGK